MYFIKKSVVGNTIDVMDENNKNSDDDCNEEKQLINESSSAIVSEKKPVKLSKRRETLSEEKKASVRREKNRLRMKALRESLSDEQKAQIREQERFKRRQQRARRSDDESDEDRKSVANTKQQNCGANSSDEEIDGLNVKRPKTSEAVSPDEARDKVNLRQQSQATVSDDAERALDKKKDAERHRQRYHEESSFPNEKNDKDEAVERAQYWISYRERRNAQSRIYRRERYAKLKEADLKLSQITDESQNPLGGGVSETELQQLKTLADKRKKILEYSRNYNRTHQKQSVEQSEIPVEGCAGSGQRKEGEEVRKRCEVQKRLPHGNGKDECEEESLIINFER